MPASALTCQSRIMRVVVYARGALVTRSVDLPAELPDDSLELRVAGVSPFADPGGVRALAHGARQVLGIRSRIVVPERSAGGGELLEKVRQLHRDRQVLESRQAELLSRREGLLAQRPRAGLNGRSRKADPAGRTDDALAVSTLFDELCADLDAHLTDLGRRLDENGRAIAIAQAEYEQANTSQRAIPGHPMRDLFVRLAPGKGRLERLDLEYAIPAARWWPAYTARISQGSAQLTLEAFVAQASFEDWSNVRIGLCTADLAQDARLPELPSLRLGRAQPPKRSGFRPPPEGLEVLFEGYDRLPHDAVRQELPPPPEIEPPADVMEDLAYDEELVAPAEAELSVREERVAMKKAMDRHATPLAMPAAMPPAAPAAASMASLAPTPARRPGPPPKPEKSLAFGRRSPAMVLDEDDGLANLPPEPEPAAPAEEDVGEAWLDFDNLRLAAAAEPRRGHLVPHAPSPAASMAESARRTIENLSDPSLAIDPLAARGQFDYRFDAEGLVEVPSNGMPHRISLRAAEAKVEQRFRTVPREGPEVYREAELLNPFDAPLLGGPVDVFVEGALLTTTGLAAVDKGGRISLGLGVEERLRVARNARVEEVSLGMLGGKTGVDHVVSIEIASALGRDLELEVVDRIPVTDDKDVEVALVAGEPKPETYNQAERGNPVRGGLRWKLPVKAGAKAAATFTYRITLPSKSEIQGGNRRE